MHLLGVSTSTARASLAVLCDERPLGEHATLDQRAHAARLFEGVEALLASAGLDRASLDVVAVDVGPGSFTGIRVGVASALGLALAVGARTVGVTSLEALAAAERERSPASDAVVIAVLDAKKGELFAQSFVDGAATSEPVALGRTALEAFVRDAEARAGRAAIVVGEVEGLAEAWSSGTSSGTSSGAPTLVPALPEAAVVARVARARLAAGVACEPSPLYVRAPDITRPAPR